jgi:hypothetical protein
VRPPELTQERDEVGRPLIGPEQHRIGNEDDPLNTGDHARQAQAGMVVARADDPLAAKKAMTETFAGLVSAL